MERNPITYKNEFHDYLVQTEIKGISAQLASFPKTRSLGRPAISANSTSCLVLNYYLLLYVFIINS